MAQTRERMRMTLRMILILKQVSSRARRHETLATKKMATTTAKYGSKVILLTRSINFLRLIANYPGQIRKILNMKRINHQKIANLQLHATELLTFFKDIRIFLKNGRVFSEKKMISSKLYWRQVCSRIRKN